MPVTSPDRPDTSDVMSTTEAAIVARVSADKIRRAIRLGELPAESMGDRYVLRRAAVEAWAAQRRGERGEEGQS